MSNSSSGRRRGSSDQQRHAQPSTTTHGARHHYHHRRSKLDVAASAAANDANDAIDGASPKPTSYRDKLAAYGVAGVVAYGILNTLYYTCAFAFAWLYLQPNGPPATGQGWAAAAKAAGAVMALTWAGSQVTKVARAGGAVALAPLVNRLLDWVAARLGGKGGGGGAGGDGSSKRSKGRAVALVVCACLLVWAGVFFGVLASVA